MNDLEALYPSVSSVSIVPAGLTCHRQGLYPLEPFTQDECCVVIDTVEEMAKKCRKKHGSRIFWCGDEFYLKAKRPIHGERYYEGYQQLDNGVGLITSFKSEFDSAIADLNKFNTEKSRHISIATGEAAYSLISSMIMTMKVFCPNLNCSVYKVKNNFYGENVTVAGLIVGRDLEDQLMGRDLGDTLLLPSVMLKKDDCVFLDDVTPTELEEKLNVKIRFIDNDGLDFVRAVLDE
jgi:NifB/MoaA-like Fe-S oxidoreductase